MRVKMLGMNLMVASAVGLFAASAVAQDAPPPPDSAPPTASGPPVEAAPAPAPAPAPIAEAPLPTPPLTTEGTVAAGTDATGLPAPGTAPAAAEPPDEPSYPPAWFRIDSDGAGLQLWAGATYPLSDTVGLATDMYVYAGPVGEFDIGPAITAGPVVLTPMMGIVFNWAERRATSLVPQLFAVGGPDPIYFELWAQMFLNTVFVDEADDQLYLRFFIDYEVSDYFALGPQVEATLNVGGDEDTVASLPVGGNVMLTNYGKGNTLLFFLGYETNEDAREASDDNALTGRLTFVRNF